jgi:tetratricopeptide (TPR) repeat protein
MERRNDVRLVACASAANFSLTDGELTMSNLQAQIAGREQQLMENSRVAVADQAELIELVAMRGFLLGVIADYELAEERADELCRNHPDDGTAYLSRARSRARFHLFEEALTDLDDAERFGADRGSVCRERATIFQAKGEYETALAFFVPAAEMQRSFAAVGALAVLHSERNDSTATEKFFHESLDLYRGVSPIPLAILEFQFGHMWMSQQNLDRARFWFQTALDRLPGFAPAGGHLAEVEAMCGETDCAIARLIPLTTSSDDPDYAAALARILNEIGRTEEANTWRIKAAVRYEDLLSRHRDAFADHAAEFLLEQGNDPQQALSLAQRNLEIRCTLRAQRLFERACADLESYMTRASLAQPKSAKDRLQEFLIPFPRPTPPSQRSPQHRTGSDADSD